MKNHTIKHLTIDVQLKKFKTNTTEDTASTVSLPKNSAVRQELEKLIGKGHLAKADKTSDNCFASPAVVTIKNEKSIKIALDSRKLNEACIKRKATMPNLVELISKILAEITKYDEEI